jgi:TRAP-type mannitol/chloroaromatic compound transport system substrate-binding protein
MINRELYAGLPNDLQKIVEFACRASYGDMLDEFTARNTAALTELVDKHRVQLKQFPEAVLQRLAQTSREVVAEIAAKDAMSKKIHESYLKFRSQAVKWNRIGEEGYSLARSLTL